MSSVWNDKWVRRANNADEEVFCRSRQRTGVEDQGVMFGNPGTALDDSKKHRWKSTKAKVCEDIAFNDEALRTGLKNYFVRTTDIPKTHDLIVNNQYKLALVVGIHIILYSLKVHNS